MIKGIAQELDVAAKALEIAARRFKNITGQGGAAVEAHKAALRAQDAAEGLIGA